ncbi:hypothetical protein BD289DRAFT_132314 [Coniella lustricola]|uniref:Uncharacterized protein n=1 Tax=Coniella lustricola TaxID=2025994 RepID=A0A2T2ZVY6_9PEZI|nr:hypothetical protein BD289DRAFT_132314 [Coniella lustricola]
MLASARTAYLGFALGALVAALPQPATHSPTSRHHRQSQRKDLFSLAMQVDGTYFPLVAVNNGTADLVLQAATDEGVKHGTPAYTNTTTSPSTNTNGYNTSLVLDLTAQDSHDAGCAPGGYGVAVADPGDLYGISLRVNAVLGYQEFDFAIVDGALFLAVFDNHLYRRHLLFPSIFSARSITRSHLACNTGLRAWTPSMARRGIS